MERFGIRIGALLALILCGIAMLTALCLLAGRQMAWAAQSITVCPAGPPACDYASIQAAVDAASDGDVVKVAGGIYRDVHSRSAPTGYPDPPDSGIILQVVYIDKSITLRGGYSTAFTDPPNPENNPTTLDAQGQGRVLCMIGEIIPIVEGVRLTGGDATGLGGNPWEGDAGGGVYVLSAAATISDSQLFGNDGEHGGGLFLAHSVATLLGNTFSDNSADKGGKGGGLFLYHSPAAVSGNIIAGNSGKYGGGLLLWNSAATVDHNTIEANTADWGGGATQPSVEMSSCPIPPPMAAGCTWGTAPPRSGATRSFPTPPATLAVGYTCGRVPLWSAATLSPLTWPSTVAGYTCG
jgi:hypothetical protein